MGWDRYAAQLVTMKSVIRNRLGIAAAVVVLVLVSTSCNGGQAWVATVDGRRVSAENFAVGAKEFAALQQGAASKTRLGILPMADAASWAQYLVGSELVEVLAAREKVVVSEDQIAAEKKNIAGQVAEFGKTPAWFQTRIARTSALQQAMIEKFGAGTDQTEQARTAYEGSKIAFTSFCFDLIASHSQAEADKVHGRIAAGESFADVAGDVATEELPAAGEKADGDVGCQPANTVNQVLGGQALAAFDKATPDTLLDVIESQSVYYVIRMREKKVQSFDEVKDQILQQLTSPGEEALTAKMQKLIAETTIELNPRYGTWSPEKGFALPTGAEQPAGATSTTLPLISQQG